jgi:LacI family transcriptional regulator
MKEAGLHLLDLGHRRIGLIGGTPVRPALERRAGLEDAFAARGLPATYTADEGSFAVEHGATAMRRYLGLPEPPTAVIAGGNQLMLGALRVVAERGIALGRDLSFVGCDDVAITDLFQPAVSVVRRDNVAMGRTAAELILGRLRDDAVPEDVVLPTEFVARPSCGPPP